MNMEAKFIARNLTAFHRELQQYDRGRKKNAETAVRVELFRLRNLMKKDLRRGQAGSQTFAPLRAISKYPPSSRRKPMAKLAVAVRYWYERLSNGDTRFSLGFKGGDVWGQGQDRSNRRNLVRSIQTSSSWRNIAQTLQEGTTTPIHAGNWLRKFKIYMGGVYEKRQQYPRLRKFFFLKKSTTAFTTPPRPIVTPFWRAHEHEAERNIISNFNRKMRGERI